MMRALIRIIMTVAISATTCVFVMMRYANVSVADVLNSARSQQQTHAKLDQKIQVDQVVPIHQGQPEPESEVRETDTPVAAERGIPQVQSGQFDVQKLSTDLATVSQALKRFNEMISEEINKLKAESSKTKTVDPTNTPS